MLPFLHVHGREPVPADKGSSASVAYVLFSILMEAPHLEICGVPDLKSGKGQAGVRGWDE